MSISDLSKVGGSSAWVGFLDSAGLVTQWRVWGWAVWLITSPPPPLFLSPPPSPGVPSPFYWVQIDLGNGGGVHDKGCFT